MKNVKFGLLALAVICVWVFLGPVAFGQTPVFEDLLTDSSKIAGQWGSGTFSTDGYTLSHDGGYCTTNPDSPRSVDYVWYDLPGSWLQGTIEFDVRGLNPNIGCEFEELMATCDSTGLNPATTSDDFYSSPYWVHMRKLHDDVYGTTNKMKMNVAVLPNGREARTNVLTWNGSETYRFRMTWSGTVVRFYRGTPGLTLSELNPPSPFDEGAWTPSILHLQVGSTFRAGPRRVGYSGGSPNTVYSLLRVFASNLGGAATPPRGWNTAVTIDMGTTDNVDGLSRVVVSDGDTTPVTIGDRDARRNQDPNTDNYFYFNVNDLFAYQGSNPDLYVMIDYYDTGSGALTLQYDATDGNKYKTGGSVALTGTNTWKQYAYHVTDAYFGNRQNGGADFRIFGGVGNVFYLDIVAVSVDSPLPPKAGNPSPAHLATGVSREGDLSWAPAEGATSYDVYFGSSSSPVFQGNQAQTTFDPGTMDPLTNYFWRIDTINGLGATTGDIWRFTTASYAGDFDGDLDVDQEDFGHFQACFSGHGVQYPAGCEDADFDLDGNVDENDLSVFQACMGGPNRPPGC